jgi:hypothetical protein
MSTCALKWLALRVNWQNEVDESIGMSSNKTLELWQILGSVENLLVSQADANLAFCKARALRVPLAPPPPVAPVVSRGSWQERCEQGLRTKIVTKREGRRGPAPASSAVDIEAEGRKAMERLDAVCMYITDYIDTAVAYEKKQQQQQQQETIA